MDENFSKMPKTDSPQMEKIEFAVPAHLRQEAIRIAEMEGWKPSELHRIFWERGFAAYCEGSNKRLINKKLQGELGRETGTETENV